MTSRVLVVDDYEPWRSHVTRRMLGGSARWTVVAEAADGADAIEKARALQPDVILLDIGLPGLDGIQAAAQILADNPSSRILFVSEHRSPGVVEAALATGARGYVIKSESAAALLPAMSAIVGGGRFVSASVAGFVARTGPGQAVAHTAGHRAGFHADQESLLDDYAQFAERALGAGAALIVFALESRQALCRQRLGALGLDADVAIREGRVRLFAVEEMLSAFMVDDWPDAARFSNAVAPVLSGAGGASPGTRRLMAWGEAAPTLWSRGHANAAIRVEELWNEVVTRYDVETLCGYPSIADVDDPAYQRVCAAHTSVHVR